MAKQTINLGTAPSGAGGDTPRSAFTKAQANIDELYAALGGSTLPAALPVLNGGTGATTAAAARIALGLATSILDAVPIANGGTGATTVAAALANLGVTGAYTKSNIIGTVSQVGGAPTGAIIEHGRNANGDYTKYADGTLICSRIDTYSSLINSPAGALYFAPAAPAAAYASTFATAPAVSQTLEGSGINCWASPIGLSTLTQWTGVYPLSNTTQPTATLKLHRIAIGVWF